MEVDKYIDLNQFAKTKDGRISWKNSIGITAEFYYNGIRHEVTIINTTEKIGYILVSIDGNLPEVMEGQKIKKLKFEKEFHQPNYMFSVGEIIGDGKIIVTEQKVIETTSRGKPMKLKAYTCKCLIDNSHTWTIDEFNLKNKQRCPLCRKMPQHLYRELTGSILQPSIKETHPELVKYFENEHDAELYSSGIDAKVDMICPKCGSKVKHGIISLVRYGFFCPMCSDGISYPNKFARNLFSQLSSQYDYYEYEWSPEWAGRYKYDNYIILKDGRKIIVEMDGGFHYNGGFRNQKNNDNVKDELARQHGINVIRVDCNYPTTNQRFEYIKNSVVNSLSFLFGLKNVDWSKCNHEDSLITEVCEFYSNNKDCTYDMLEQKFLISRQTLYSYLKRGTKLGICNFTQMKKAPYYNTRKPVCINDESNNSIRIFRSAHELLSEFPCFKSVSLIQEYARKNKTVNGYKFSYSTIEEYDEFVDNLQVI